MSEILKELFQHQTIVIGAFVFGGLVAFIPLYITMDKELRQLYERLMGEYKASINHKVQKINRKRVEIKDLSNLHVHKRDPNI